METKISTSIDALCAGFPIEFHAYLTYCRNLQFQDKPDYSYLKRLFKDLFLKMGYNYDYVYDWDLINS